MENDKVQPIGFINFDYCPDCGEELPPVKKEEEETMKRLEIKDVELEREISTVKSKLAKRMEVKGYGAYASRHEALGIIEEEMCELKEEVHGGANDEICEELQDIAVGCIVALASIKNGKTEW